MMPRIRRWVALLLLCSTFASVLQAQATPPSIGDSLIVPDGQIAILFDRISGELVEPLGPGTHPMDGQRQFVTFYSTRVQRLSFSDGDNARPRLGAVEARSADGLALEVSVNVQIRIVVEQIKALHGRWAERYLDDFVVPTVRAALRDVVAAYKADALYGSGRATITQQIRERLQAAFSAESLELVDFSLEEVVFPQPFVEAIEARAAAEAEMAVARLNADATRTQAQGRADAALIQARTEAEALALRAQGLASSWAQISEPLAANPLLLYVLYIDMLEATANQWRTPPTLALPAASTPR